MSEDPIALLFRLGLGPWLTPLRAKIPVLDAWESQPPVDEDRVRDWLSLHFNLGLRTGARSGVVVIDDDQARNGVSGYVAPPTGLVCRTPTGGTHSYYRCPDPAPRNSASKIAPYVDLRAEGGQVVVPPSIHPTARAAYVWEAIGEPGVFPTVPDAPAPAGTVIDMRSEPSHAGAGYASSALHREVHAVRTATEGSRNHTLNKAAFSLGQLAASGALDTEAVRSELHAAATIAGLSEHEATATIESGLKGGAKQPRGVPDRSVATAPRPAAAPASTPGTSILVPGSHNLPGGEYVEQGNHTFAAQVLAALPQGQIYRRAGAVGELHDGQFVQVTVERLRSIVDNGVRLQATKIVEEEPVEMFRTCTRDNASVLLEYAAVRGNVRDLKFVATYPVCVGAEFTVAKPGWNPDSGVFQFCDLNPAPLPIAEGRAVLDDLICDFPFASDSDRANYIGLLLTAILRPAINEPVPMHLIGSPIERTGKTKLAEIVLGCAILGHPTPAMQLGVREEEREKRIIASLLAGDPVVHLDNLHDFLDSASLSSLLTSTFYRGRELGLSRLLNLPNACTIVGTGNNVHATGEMSKRIVPVLLQPATESPETRQDYRHPFLRAYVEGERPRVLGALLGFVASWCQAGRPMGGVGFGGFERWSAVVGGVMAHAGYPDHLGNLKAWRGGSDDFGSELRALVGMWAPMYRDAWVSAEDLFGLAYGNDLFSRKLGQPSDTGRRTAFGRLVLSAAAGRVVGSVRIEVEGSGKRRRARLVPAATV